MNSENNNPYIPHIAAVIDSIGEAVHIECGFDPESQLYLAFSRFVNNEMTILDKGTHVPYYRILYYVFPADVSLKEMRLHADEYGALKNFVQKFGGRLIEDIPLQTVVHLHRNSGHLLKQIWPRELRKLSDPVSKRQLDQDADMYLNRL